MGLRNRSYRPEGISSRQIEPLIDTPIAQGRQATDDCCVSITEKFTAATEIVSPVSGKPQILVCGATDPPALMQALGTKGYDLASNSIKYPLSPEMPSLLQGCDMVLLDVTTEGANVLKTLEEFHAAIGLFSIRPRVLCYSTVHRNSQFVLGVEESGARYVRVTGPAMLLEAIDLLLTEMVHFERNGPCFQIVHRFSQGSCAPGEEITAILLAHSGNFFQLPIALAQRFVFDFLAKHQRVALDSVQIVSGLSADWFYRDHAANSGRREVKKIRRPTIKVLVKRIRDAMTETFAKAQVRFDPADVLRSCPAKGSKRVLYQFHADIRWRHIPLC